MVTRLWNLLDVDDRRRVLLFVPLLVITAVVEVIGVAAVIPFLALLADPDSVFRLPVAGPLLQSLGVDEPLTLLRIVGATVAVALLLANTLVILTNWRLVRYAMSLNLRLSSRLLRHYLAQPYVFTLTRNTAALSNKVIVEVRNLIENGYLAGLEVLTRGVLIFAIVSFLVLLDPVLAAAVFGTFATAYAAIFFLGRRYHQRLGRESVAMGASRMKAVNQALAGFKDLKVTGREASAFSQYDAPARRWGEVQAAHRAIATLPRYALEAVAVGGLVLIASLLAGRDGTIASTLPLLGAYAFAGLRLLPAMQQLYAALARMRFAGGSLETVEADFAEIGSEEGSLGAPARPLTFERSIVLRGVTFAYAEGDAPVLEDVTLEIPHRRSLAVVGRTGSGKSTLIDLLLGLLEPARGVIEVDGVPVTAERRRAYRRLFGYVPQSIYLLDDSVTNNVAFGLEEASIDMAAVRRACELAQIASFVEDELSDGYATIVGERGVRLSGGQRQRIGIARALYHQPPVLVLDEATSALDLHTEAQLYKALDAIARSHTVITVAHRLDTVATADVVVVLEGGRLVDQGPPADVLSRYRHLEAPEATLLRG